MKGKPVMTTGFKTDVSEDVESKLTIFQRFIKKFIECDELEESISNKNQSLQKILSTFIDKSSSLFERGEKELCLFLRKVCLADHFLLINDNESKLIDWKENLSPRNLSQKFGVTFSSIDISNGILFSSRPNM